MADAGPGRHAGEARVGDQRDLAAEREELQRRRELVGLLHPGAERPAPGEHDDVAGLDRLGLAGALDGRDRVRARS